jgi:L-fucose dehydrogenase
MDLQLKDKIVVVTGGAKGIGGAISTICAQEGAVAVIVDRDTVASQQIHDVLRARGGSAHTLCMDLSSAGNCEDIVRQTVSKFGRIDALANNAGINDQVGLEHGTPEEFVSSLERNLLHYYYMAHYSLPQLKSSRGAIVNISSKTALTGQGGTSGYVASKGAILGLTRGGLRDSGKRGDSRRGHDFALPEVARQLPFSRRKTEKRRRKDTFRKTNDHGRRDCEHGCITAFT